MQNIMAGTIREWDSYLGQDKGWHNNIITVLQYHYLLYIDWICL